MQLGLAPTSVLLSNLFASEASLSCFGCPQLGWEVGSCASAGLLWAGPRMGRLGEYGTLPAAQMESEIRGHGWACQLGARLSKHLLGHLICRALLAVAPHPALPPRGFLACQFSLCPLHLVGMWLQGSGRWAGPQWTLGS